MQDFEEKKHKKDSLVGAAEELTRITEDFNKTRPQDVNSIAAKFKDFEFLPTRK